MIKFDKPFPGWKKIIAEWEEVHTLRGYNRFRQRITRNNLKFRIRGQLIEIAYRGFKVRPFIRVKPIMIGWAKLYTFGCFGVFFYKKEGK